jgi:hypothetical protein
MGRNVEPPAIFSRARFHGQSNYSEVAARVKTGGRARRLIASNISTV